MQSLSMCASALDQARRLAIGVRRVKLDFLRGGCRDTNMVVRIRLRMGPAFSKGLARHRQAASLVAALLTPAAVMAFVLGFWRLGSDLKLTGEFAISSGLFSHWQVWFAAAGLLQTCASILNRYGRARSHPATSQ